MNRAKKIAENTAGIDAINNTITLLNGCIRTLTNRVLELMEERGELLVDREKLWDETRGETNG